MTSHLSVRGGPVAIAIGEALTQAAARTGRSVDDLTMRQWLQAFANCEADEIRQAFWTFALHKGQQPTVADIVSELDPLRFGGVSGAWMHAFHAAREARSGGDTFFVVFEHAAIHFAIEATGGWRHFQEQVRRPDGLGYLRRDFFAAFEDYRPGNRYPAGFGYFTGHNAVFIGHPERAHGVYKRGSKSSTVVVPGLEILRGVEYLNPGDPPHQLPSEMLPSHLAPRPEPPIRRLSYPWETSEVSAPK